MNLLMCCTPLGKENRYREELRFVLLASLFFKSIYPQSKIFVGTTKDADIPKSLSNIIEFIRFPFEKLPFAMARIKFYEEFTKSKLFIDDTFFVGSDVLFLKKPDRHISDQSHLAMTYRYHLTMPYCSDLIFVKKQYQQKSTDFFSNVYKKMEWMPAQIQDGYADQLSIAIEMGFLNVNKFDGKTHNSPNNSKYTLLPGNDFLYTPNDFFSSIKSDTAGQIINDVPDIESLEALANTKHVIHFKGDRKKLFIIFSYLCKKNNIIKFNSNDYDYDESFLFKEFFDQYKGR
jgi:hypothetical protein